MDDKLILYTREKCPLCDRAKEIMEQFSRDTGMAVEEVDIYQDDALIEEFGLMIPVIKWKGELLQYGRVSKNELYQFFSKEKG